MVSVRIGFTEWTSGKRLRHPKVVAVIAGN
jgi:hypothetical protein